MRPSLQGSKGTPPGIVRSFPCGDRCVDADPLPGKTEDDIPEGKRSFQERAVYRLCAVCIEDLNEHLGFRMEMRSYQGFKLLWDKMQGTCRSCSGVYTGTWFAPGGTLLADDMCFPCAKVLHNRRLDRSLYRPVGFESFDSCESEILCEVCGRIVYEDVASDRSWAYARLADSCIGCKDFDAENRDPFAPFRPFFEPILKIANKRHKFTACAICGEIGGAWLGCFVDCETPLCYDHAVQYQEAKEKRGVNIVEEHCERMAEAFDDDMIDEATDEEAILRRMRWEQLYPRTPEPHKSQTEVYCQLKCQRQFHTSDSLNVVRSSNRRRIGWRGAVLFVSGAKDRKCVHFPRLSSLLVFGIQYQDGCTASAIFLIFGIACA